MLESDVCHEMQLWTSPAQPSSSFMGIHGPERLSMGAAESAGNWTPSTTLDGDPRRPSEKYQVETMSIRYRSDANFIESVSFRYHFDNPFPTGPAVCP